MLSDVLLGRGAAVFLFQINGYQTLLSTQCELGSFTCVTSFNSCDNPSYCVHFLGEETETQRGSVACLGELGFEPRVFSAVQELSERDLG